MSTEACNLALKNTLNEIRNVCPDISHAMVFRENGEILVEDENITENTVNCAQEVFHTLLEKSTAVGGIESITVGGTESRVNIIRFDDLYVTTVTSGITDEKTVSNLTRVMIPITLKIVQNIYMPIKNKNENQEVVFKPEPKTRQLEIISKEINATEFIVETLAVFGGFMIDQETAYIDRALLVEWKEKYGDQPITQIALDVPSNGKTTTCKFQPFRDSKYENRNIVQLPKKIQISLNIQKGTKVLIKPIFEVQEDSKDISVKETETPNDLIEISKVNLSEVYEHKQSSSVIQVMVENFRGGILGKPDCVRVESIVIARWNEMFGVKEIKEVTVEDTLSGKKIRCKLQAIKDSQLEGKGVIQLPEKLQQALGTKKGALVLIKPITEKSEGVSDD
jgi:hypothetical protein